MLLSVRTLMYATNTRSPRQFHSNNFHWVNEPNCLHRANYYLRSLQFLNYSENSCPVEPATPPRGHRLVPQWCCCQSLPVLLLQLQHWLLGRSVLQVCRYHNGVCVCIVCTYVCMYVCLYLCIILYVCMYVRGVVNKFPDWIFRAHTECSYHTSR